MRPGPRLLASVGLLAMLGASLVACGSDDGGPDSASGSGDSSADSEVVPEEVATYEEAGPHAVEQLTATLDGTEGPAEVRIWAPTDGDAGPWPLLVYAHGLGLSAQDYDRELSHAASWGFVTAAPEKAKDVDLVKMAGQLYEAAGDPGNPLNARINSDEPLVVGGMSQGTGYAATSAAAAPDDVSGVLLVSGGGAAATGGAGPAPTMILAGGRDPAMSSWMEPGFEAAEGPATLVVVEDAGHSSFSAACTSETRASMVGANPEDCAPVEVGEEALWPAIDHTIVAFLRWATSQDGSAAALSEEVVGSLGASVTVSGDLDSE